MKKTILLLAAVICSACTLFAGAESDVVNVVLQVQQTAAEGKLDKTITFYTDDAKGSLNGGEVVTCKMMKELMVAADGAHPYEFLIFVYKTENNGKAPTPEDLQVLKKMAESSSFSAMYKTYCEEIYTEIKEASLLELKTMQFREVKVEGSTALVTITADSIDAETRKVIRLTTTYKLKMVNGAWKICEDVTVE